MIGYAILLGLICIILFFCCVDHAGIISDKLLYAIMFIIMAFTTTNVDMGAYKSWYQYITAINRISVTDPGFGFLMYISNMLQLDYYSFLKCLTIAGLVFVAIVFRKKARCPAMALALYFVLVFLTVTIQIRSFIAEPILYIMLIDIVDNDIFNIKRFFTLLLLAVLFHASSFFFALLLLMVVIKNQRRLIVIVSAAILAVPSSAVILRYVPIPMIQKKIQYYLYDRRTTFFSGVFLYIALFLMLMIGIYYTKMITDDIAWQNKLDRLMQINIICLIACAMIIVFSSNFYRIIRVVMVVDSLILTNCLYETGRLDVKKQAIAAFIIIVLFLGPELMTGALFEMYGNNTLMNAVFGIT